MPVIGEKSMAARGSDMRRATAFDVRVGQRLKRRRATIGVTQENLAAEIGISWQQLQKYEAGTNRISAARLAAIATALKTDVEWFLRPDNDVAAPESAAPASDPPPSLSQDEISELLAAYSSIQSPAQRRVAIAILKVLSAGADGA